MKDVLVRRRILEMVFAAFKEHPYNRITPKGFKEELGIELKQLYFNVAYLAEKGYLDLQTPLEGSFFVGARITAKGIDLLEDKLRFDILFPPGDELVIHENIFAAIRLLKGAVNEATDLEQSDKELILENLKDIESELKEVEPSYSSVKKLLKYIVQRHEETGQKLRTILQDKDVQKLLLRSARKELENISD